MHTVCCTGDNSHVCECAAHHERHDQIQQHHLAHPLSIGLWRGAERERECSVEHRKLGSDQQLLALNVLSALHMDDMVQLCMQALLHDVVTTTVQR